MRRASRTVLRRRGGVTRKDRCVSVVYTQRYSSNSTTTTSQEKSEPKWYTPEFFRIKSNQVRLGWKLWKLEREAASEYLNTRKKLTHPEYQFLRRVKSEGPAKLIPFGILAVVLPEAIPALLYFFPNAVPSQFYPVFGAAQRINAQRTDSEAKGLQELNRWVEKSGLQEALSKPSIRERLQAVEQLVKQHKISTDDEMFVSAVSRINNTSWRYVPALFKKISGANKWAKLKSNDQHLLRDDWSTLKSEFEQHDDYLDETVNARGISQQITADGQVKELGKNEKIQAIKYWRQLSNLSSELAPFKYALINYRFDQLRPDDVQDEPEHKKKKKNAGKQEQQQGKPGETEYYTYEGEYIGTDTEFAHILKANGRPLIRKTRPGLSLYSQAMNLLSGHSQ